MVRLFKRVMSIVLCAALLFGSAPLSGFVFRSQAAGYKPGDTIVFGHYPQTVIDDDYLKAKLAEQPYDAKGIINYGGFQYIRIDNKYYGYLPITWQVFSVDGSGIYVVAQDVLDYQKYNNLEENTTWAECTLRSWLNSYFFDFAFTPSEKSKIQLTHLINGDNPDYGTQGGEDTYDRIYVPSLADMKAPSAPHTSVIATPYAKSKGVKIDKNSYYYSSYWLRTPGQDNMYALFSYGRGSIELSGRNISDCFYYNEAKLHYGTGIRPALRLQKSESYYQAKSYNSYSVKALDAVTEQPADDVEIKFNGDTMGFTGSDGSFCLTIGNDVDPTQEVRFEKGGFTTEIRRLYELNPYGQNEIELETSLDISYLFSDIDFAAERVDGPTVNLLGNSFPLFSFNAKVKLGSFSFKFKQDTKNKTVKYIIGLKDGYKVESEEDFNKNYDDFKDFYKGFSEQTQHDNYFRYNKIKDRLMKQKGQLGFDADLSAAGYAEFDYSTGKLLFKEGGVAITAEAAVSEDVPFGLWCYATFKIGGEIEGKLSVSMQDSGYLQFNSKITLSVKPSIEAGAKLLSKKVASIGVGIDGKITGSVKIPAASLAEAFEASLSAQCYVRANLFFAEGKWSTNFPSLQLYPNFGQLNSCGIDLMLDADGNIITIENNDDLKLVDRSYLKSTPSLKKAKARGAGDTSLNETSVYPYGSPKLVQLDDGRVMALYLYDDGTKSDINRTALYYSVYENNTWSNPAPVCDSGFADFPAEVCTNGQTVYAVWCRANQVLPDNSSVDNVLDKTELVYASFNGAGWSTPTVIDTAGRFQAMYSIAENNGEVAVLWGENNLNDYLLSSGTTTLCYKTLNNGVWSGITTVTSNSGIADAVVGYEANELKVLYLLDTDGNLSTPNDIELYLNGSRITNNEVDEAELTYQNGNFYWIQSGMLTSIYGTTGLQVESDYRVLTHGNTTAVTSLVNDGFRNELEVSYLNGDTYTEPVVLTSYGKHISYYDAILNADGTISLIADVENLNDGDGYPYTTTDMVCDVIGGRTDLSISGVTYIGEVTRGSTIQFSGTVTNTGTTPVSGYRIEFKNANGSIIRSADQNEVLQSGESTEFAYSYFVPDTFTKQMITAEVTFENDEDASNNSDGFVMGYADVDIVNATISESGVITATLVNNGCETAQNVSLKVSAFKEETAELTTLIVGDIGIGETKTVTYVVSGSALTFDSVYVVNKFILNAASESEEEILANNDYDVIFAPKRVQSVELNTSSLDLAYGSTTQLVATVYPSDANNKSVYWVSDSTDVVTVDNNGNVTAVGDGSAIITAITDDGGFIAQCEITSSVRVTSIELDNSNVTLNVGNTVTLTASVMPATAQNRTVTWSSSDASAASVSGSGVVRGLKTGTAIITARTSDGGFEANCTVNVINPVNGITISENAVSLYTGKTKQLYAAVTPADADNQQIVWSTDNDNVAEVSDNGLVTAVGSGTATITAMALDGHYTATCTVTVGKHVTSVFISDSTLSLPVGFSEQLTATVFPFSALNKTVYWMSTNTKVATVDENGVVTAVKAGSTTIIVYSEDGEYAANCTVAVTNSVGGFSLTDDEVYIARNGSKQLTGVFAPATAENQNVTWTSTNTAIATVDENGLVTGRMAGTAMIVATTEDGGFKDYCSVKVIGVDAISTAHIDFNSGVITGLNANLDSLDDYITVSESGCALQYESLGTNSVVYLTRNDEIIDAYTVVIFGDVDGNGWYDGTDAYFVKLVTNGMIPATALTEAQRMAADCNHDGRIDGLDVATLEQAGLLLANVNQTLPSEELQTDSVYLEYCSLIDQSIEIIELDQPSVTDEPTAEQGSASTVWQIIFDLFKRLVSFVTMIFSIIVIPK